MRYTLLYTYLDLQIDVCGFRSFQSTYSIPHYILDPANYSVAAIQLSPVPPLDDISVLYTVFAIFLAMMLLFKTNAQLKIRVQGVAPTFPPNWLLDINHYIYILQLLHAGNFINHSAHLVA